MKHLYSFLLLCCTLCAASCTLLSKEDPELLVQIVSLESGEITHESAQISITYTVQNQGSEPVSWGYAVAKSRAEAADPANMTPVRVSGRGIETVTVSGLEPDTEYYAGAAIFVGSRAFNGNCLRFHTSQRPVDEGSNEGGNGEQNGEGGQDGDIAVSGVQLVDTPEEIKMKVGDDTTLAVRCTPTNAKNRAVKWTISDRKVVDSFIKVGTHDASLSTLDIKAHAAGTATVTATTDDGGFTATVTITVE